MTFKERQQQYEEKQRAARARIKEDPSRWRRFWKTAWFLWSWPFKWIWMECHDWRFLVLFGVVIMLVGSEVWVPLVIAVVATVKGATELATVMYSVAGACEAFWIAPFTPFIPLCAAITFGIKTLWDRMAKKEVSQ